MKKTFLHTSWSPYIVGALLGLLLTSMFVLGHQIGSSSGIAALAALLTKVASLPINAGSYFDRLLSSDMLYWKVIFVSGIFIGALVGNRLNPKSACTLIKWERAFGPSKLKRHIGAFCGGFLLLFGARVANGCTSGHAISGGAQLSITSWLFMLSLFACAIPVSMILYKRQGGE